VVIVKTNWLLQPNTAQLQMSVGCGRWHLPAQCLTVARRRILDASILGGVGGERPRQLAARANA
jgi:hypothetical protein